MYNGIVRAFIMKKVLFITAFLPSDNAAAEKNTRIMLEDLSIENIVDLVYFRYSTDSLYQSPNKNIRIIEAFKNSLIRKILCILFFPFIHPIFSVRFSWFKLYVLKKKIRQGKYDVIICDHSQTFLYAKYLDKSIPKILLSHDVIAQRVSRTSSKLMYKICVLSEKFCLNIPNSHIFSFCQKDCDLIESIYNIKALLCFDYIDPQIINVEPLSIGNYFVFIGKWSRADNLDGVVWFMEKVVPLLTEKTNIKIIGKAFPHKYLSHTSQNVHIDYLGFVDNPYPLIANAKALLSPLFTGAGIKVKVVESLACGTPVIGTNIAFEGFSSDYSQGMILAEDANSFAKAMQNLNMGLQERIVLKNKFINNYRSITIPKFIKTIS